MGPAKIEKGMKPVKGTPEELAALTELVYSQTGASDVNTALPKGERSCSPRRIATPATIWTGRPKTPAPT